MHGDRLSLLALTIAWKKAFVSSTVSRPNNSARRTSRSRVILYPMAPSQLYCVFPSVIAERQPAVRDAGAFGLARSGGVAAFCCTPLLSSASLLQSTRRLLSTPFLLTAPFSLPARIFEPPVGRRFVRKAPHIQRVLSRDQLDVVVRKPQVPGVTEQRDAPRRCDCKLAEVIDQPVPLELKYRLRRTNRDQHARAPGLPACADDRLEKGFRLLDGLAAE